MKLIPKCLNFDSPDRKPAAYTSDGFMLPCCWVDTPYEDESLKALGMRDEELKVANNESLIQIFTSDQWERFFNVLVHDSDSAPFACKYKCGVKE